jgi:16S rRNA processing protein RimM
MRILKSYGTEGGLIVSTAAIPEDFDTKEPVFIDFDELPVPFFIEEFKAHGSKKAFLKLEDIDSLQDAEELVGREIYFSIEDDDDFAGFAGLEVCDAKTGEPVGTVKEYVDIPSNPCLEVEMPDSEETVLIPCHEDLVDRIDDKKGRIFLRIPEGLL